jgi:predicted SAM-dependent methyltransferase
VKAFLKARLPRPLWFALRQLTLEIHIARLHRVGVREAARLRRGGGLLRLNLASGHVPKDGWVNVDLFGPVADLRLDLRRPLPFDDSSTSYIYAEHFFEHLEYPNVVESMGWDLEGADGPSEALQFLRECRRVLAPGGVLDIVVPDTEGMIGVYVARSETREPVVPWWGPAWCDTDMHRVNYLFRQGREHKYAYDEETLARILRSVDFRDIRRRPFNPQMDAPNHVIGSLCMTARKPVATAFAVDGASTAELHAAPAALAEPLQKGPRETV